MAGGEKFVVRDILFKVSGISKSVKMWQFAVNNPDNNMYGCDANAIKGAGHELVQFIQSSFSNWFRKV